MPLKLSAGDFTTKALFKKPNKVKIDGGIERTYIPVFNSLVAIKSIDQRRVLEAGGQMLLDTKFFYLRYAPSRKMVDKDWLIEIDGVNYTIISKPEVKESGLRVLEITAKGKHNG